MMHHRSMTTGFDLEAYFQRIGYTGPTTATLDTLAELHLRHTRAIPFENLNPLLKWPVPLDAASLQRKLVTDGRGGYCYEQNILFGHALAALGFSFVGLAARVRWNVPVGMLRPRSHMLLNVDIAGRPYIADVGFGGLTLTAPLQFDVGVEQRTPHETFRVVAAGGGFEMQARIGREWRTLYTFGTEEHLLPDYELANWWVSTHESSPFVSTLVAARQAPGRRYALRGTEFAVHALDGTTERHALTTTTAIRDALTQTFGIRLPDTPELDVALERMLRAGAVAEVAGSAGILQR
jgi:N-hydroxyarylamine O-acetyltransferase